MRAERGIRHPGSANERTRTGGPAASVGLGRREESGLLLARPLPQVPWLGAWRGLCRLPPSSPRRPTYLVKAHLRDDAWCMRATAVRCAALRCAARYGTCVRSSRRLPAALQVCTTRECTGNAWPPGSGWGPPAPLLLEEKTEGRGRRGRRPDPPAVARNWDWPRWRQVAHPLTLWPAVALLCFALVLVEAPQQTANTLVGGTWAWEWKWPPSRPQRSLILSCHAAYPARLPLFQGTKQCSCVGGLDEGATDGPPIAAGQAALAPRVFCFPPRGRLTLLGCLALSGRNLHHRIPRAPVAFSLFRISHRAWNTVLLLLKLISTNALPGLASSALLEAPPLPPEILPAGPCQACPHPQSSTFRPVHPPNLRGGPPTWGSAGQSFRRLPEGGWPSQASEPQPSRTFPLWTDVGTESETAYPNPPAAFSSPTCHRTHVTLAAEE